MYVLNVCSKCNKVRFFFAFRAILWTPRRLFGVGIEGYVPNFFQSQIFFYSKNLLKFRFFVSKISKRILKFDISKNVWYNGRGRVCVRAHAHARKKPGFTPGFYIICIHQVICADETKLV